MNKYLIDVGEYGYYLIDFIGSEDFNKIFNSMNFNDVPECKNAFIAGIAWAHILTSQIPHYEVICNEDKTSK